MGVKFPSVQRGNQYRVWIPSEAEKLKDGFPITLYSAANPRFVVDVIGPADVVGFYLSDFLPGNQSSAITFPLTAFWQVQVGSPCQIEQALPDWSGVTIFQSPDDLAQRAGRLVQLSGLYAERWTLWVSLGRSDVGPNLTAVCYVQTALTGGGNGPVIASVGSVNG